MTDPVFSVGDLVTPIYTSGYHLTMGNVYVVVKYDPPFPDDNFTWPAYVEIMDDNGKFAVAHARRFEKV
jgi:hypothetical protein